MDPVDSPEIIDDFELGQEEAVDIKDKEVNKQKLRRRASQYKVSCIVVYFKMRWKCLLEGVVIDMDGFGVFGTMTEVSNGLN